MNIQFINFKDMELNLKENESQELNFIYNGENYSIQIIFFNGDLYVYRFKVISSKIEINKILKGKELDLVFCQNNLKDDNDLSLDTLLTKYKLGVIEYV